MTTSLYEKTLQLIDAEVEAEGSFSAVVATFGPEPDRQGDVIHRGAFTASLARWRRSGQRIPIVWSHQVGDPAMGIGSADPGKSHETAEGLLLVGKLSVFDSPTAAHVRDLLKSGDISGWSFGFKIVRSSPRQGGLNLLELDLGEAGPCVMPANPATRTVSVKGEWPDRREPRRPTHVQLEQRLREAGILAQIADDGLADRERAAMLDVLGRRRNGDEDRKARMTALLAGPETVGAKTESSAPIVVATFPVA